MSNAVAMEAGALGLTARLVSDVGKIASLRLSDRVMQRARHAVLDWIGVTISGAQQPSARIAQSALLAEGGRPVANVIGSPHRMNARQAALCSGIASHSQDFDDMGLGMHPSVVVLPAVFALADELNANGAATLNAMLRGYETLKIVAATVGESSYARGFHCTGTFGAFGATAAAGCLLDLDTPQMLNALGIAGTQASGLRASFGTMCKHMNAGNAAAVGVLSARLAQGGFTGPDNVLEAPHGFANAFNSSPADFDANRPRGFLEDRLAVEEIIFKLHAACGGTHSAIDGIRALRARRPFSIGDVAAVELFVPALLPGVCGIIGPKTGLEGMFSIHYTVGLALLNRDVGPAAFTDERVHDPVVVEAQKLVKYTVTDRIAHMANPIEVVLKLKSGETLTAAVSIFEPRQDLDAQWADLEAKFHGLVAPVLGAARSHELVQMISRFETLASIRELTDKTLSGEVAT
ncbi:MAG TPA: MmgE/PrpD family protein [Steroidobacteraceae bacterium]|nr:MmgE/PrpD family protein [Steroidobacteraceae bacterium]